MLLIKSRNTTSVSLTLFVVIHRSDFGVGQRVLWLRPLVVADAKAVANQLVIGQAIPSNVRDNAFYIVRITVKLPFDLILTF